MGSSLPSGCETVMERLKRASYQAAEKKKEKVASCSGPSTPRSVCETAPGHGRADDAVKLSRIGQGQKGRERRKERSGRPRQCCFDVWRGDSERAKEAWWVRGGTASDWEVGNEDGVAAGLAARR